MKRYSIVAVLLSSVLLLSACSRAGGQNESSGGKAETSGFTQSELSDAYHKITAEQAKEMMDKGGVTVVDVRTQPEYEQGHIQGAKLVPNETITVEPPAELPDLDAVLLIHCRTGVRSRDAAQKLVGLGYRNVYDFGGIVDWTYGTVTGESE